MYIGGWDSCGGKRKDKKTQNRKSSETNKEERCEVRWHVKLKI